MSLISPSAAQAALAYRSVDSLPLEGVPAPGGGGQGGASFASMLGDALGGVIAQGKQADGLAVQAVAGHGDITQVVTAVSQAQLALQTTVAVRDRVLQAYQDIIKMPI